jgi:hypothetical protein
MSPEQQESSDNVTVQSDLCSKAVVVDGLFTGKKTNRAVSGSLRTKSADQSQPYPAMPT